MALAQLTDKMDPMYIIPKVPAEPHDAQFRINNYFQDMNFRYGIEDIMSLRQ